MRDCTTKATLRAFTKHICCVYQDKELFDEIGYFSLTHIYTDTHT